MTYLQDVVDTNRLHGQILEGYISVGHNRRGDLRIYNYTHKTQYDWFWTRETITCRGLIVDTSNRVIARPWPKFFNMDQYRDLRNHVHHLYGVPFKRIIDEDGPFTVTEKMDGCMGILYWIDDEPFIATRGSFESHQSQLATQIFREKYAEAWKRNMPDRGRHRGFTYLFECILPEYRIVVDYQGMRDLVCIGCVNNMTGRDEPYYNMSWNDYPGMPPKVESYYFDNVRDVFDTQRENAEGYVIHFHDTGIRIKVKHEEYMNLHRIMTGCTKRQIWKVLRDNSGVLYGEFDRLPDEMHKWVQEVAADLNDRRVAIMIRVCNKVDELRARRLSRKEIAAEIKGDPDAGWIFSALDGKLAQERTQREIWETLRPEAETPWIDVTYGMLNGPHTLGECQ